MQNMAAEFKKVTESFENDSRFGRSGTTATEKNVDPFLYMLNDDRLLRIKQRANAVSVSPERADNILLFKCTPGQKPTRLSTSQGILKLFQVDPIGCIERFITQGEFGSSI